MSEYINSLMLSLFMLGIGLDGLFSGQIVFGNYGNPNKYYAEGSSASYYVILFFVFGLALFVYSAIGMYKTWRRQCKEKK